MPYLAKWFALGRIGHRQAGAEISYSGGSRRADYSSDHSQENVASNTITEICATEVAVLAFTSIRVL